jgi:hypothetical protein
MMGVLKDSRAMKSDCQELSVKGKMVAVPSACVEGRTVVVTGGWVKTASVKDEDLCEGEIIADPALFVAKLKQGRTRADIFTFARKLGENGRDCSYHKELDNAAVIPIKTYSEWWEDRLPQETRRNVRRAAKLGVIVRPVEFTDDLVRGIVAIYNETSVRQGRRFWHYGKDFETVKKENATYLERSDFIGAFFGEELIGFIKMVYVDRVASIMQILSKNAHSDKRPTNALIAKAVEISEKKGVQNLAYCKYVYGKNDKNDLTEFKRRNGFERVDYPRYYVPLTLKGWVILSLRLHHGLRGVVPGCLWSLLAGLRSKCFELAGRRRRTAVAGTTT